MIVKHIPARPAGRNATVERARHARNLVDYLRQPEKQSEEKDYQVAYMLGEKLGDTRGERLFHIGARNFVSTDIDGQRAEMIAIAQAASRSPNPIDHWLLSWREGELPTPAEIDETVAMFVEHLGVGGQPCIYACHGDTDNRHVHLALNRHDPLSRRMIEINDGFTREAAHQAVALIVDRFGWQAEADARYAVVDSRLVMAASAAARHEEGRKPLSAKAAAFENRTGYRSTQRIVQEEAVPRIKAARSWYDLHAALAEVGIRYDLVGTNGVTLTVGDERVKASGINRAITRTQVEKRLGAFEPREAAVNDVPCDPKGARLAEAFRADEYHAECEQWRRHQQERREQHAALGRAGQKKIEQPRPAARKRLAQPMRPPPDLESWYYARREGIFAMRWRHRLQVTKLPEIGGVTRSKTDPPVQIDGYQGYPCSDGVRYARGPAEPTAFVDRGTKIAVVIEDDQAMLAALRLAVLKFDGKVTVNGDALFRERIFEIAQRHGLGHVLTDADLATRWRAMQPTAAALAPAASTIIHLPGMRTSEDEPRQSETSEKPIVFAKVQSDPLVNLPPENVKMRPMASAEVGSTTDPLSKPVPQPAGVLQGVRELASAREKEVLKRSWTQAFTRLMKIGRQPIRDEAGRWTIDTEGLSHDELRALSAPDREAETQKRLADMNAAHPDLELTMIEPNGTAKPGVRELGRIKSMGGLLDHAAPAAGNRAAVVKKLNSQSVRARDTGSKGPAAGRTGIKVDKGQER